MPEDTRMQHAQTKTEVRSVDERLQTVEDTVAQLSEIVTIQAMTLEQINQGLGSIKTILESLAPGAADV